MLEPKPEVLSQALDLILQGMGTEKPRTTTINPAPGAKPRLDYSRKLRALHHERQTLIQIIRSALSRVQVNGSEINMLAPDRRLPNEIFLKIIKLALENVKVDRYYPQLLQLASISRSWAIIVNSSPGLWRILPTFAHWPTIVTVLRKSKAHPLDIVPSNPTDSSITPPHWMNDPSRLLLFLQHSHRLRSAVLNLEGWNSLAQVLSQRRSSLPLLEDLSVEGETDIGHPMRFSLAPLGTGSQALRKLTLEETAPRWEEAAPFLGAMQSLTITTSSEVSSEDIHTMLLACPALDDLTLRLRYSSDLIWSGSPKPINMTRLKRIYLTASSSTIRFVLAHLAAPSCQRLRVANVSGSTHDGISWLTTATRIISVFNPPSSPSLLPDVTLTRLRIDMRNDQVRLCTQPEGPTSFYVNLSCGDEAHNCAQWALRYIVPKLPSGTSVEIHSDAHNIAHLLRTSDDEELRAIDYLQFNNRTDVEGPDESSQIIQAMRLLSSPTARDGLNSPKRGWLCSNLEEIAFVSYHDQDFSKALLDLLENRFARDDKGDVTRPGADGPKSRLKMLHIYEGDMDMEVIEKVKGFIGGDRFTHGTLEDG